MTIRSAQLKRITVIIQADSSRAQIQISFPTFSPDVAMDTHGHFYVQADTDLTYLTLRNDSKSHNRYGFPSTVVLGVFHFGDSTCFTWCSLEKLSNTM